MAIGRISGPMLYSNLERQGVDLAVEGNILYVDVTNRRIGANTTSPNAELHVIGTANLANITISGNTISSDLGKVNLGSTANITITGGSSDYVLVTDGSGNLRWDQISNLDQTWGNLLFSNNQISITSIDGNLELNANGTGSVVSFDNFYAPNVITGNVDSIFLNGDVRSSDIVVSANILAGNVNSTFYGNVFGNVNGTSAIFTSNVNADYFNGNVRGNNVVTTGNITAPYLIGELVGNIVGQVQGNVFGNVTGSNAVFTGNISANWFNGNATGAFSNFTTANAANFYGNIFAQGVVSSIGDLHLSAATNDPNNIIRFDSVSAFDIPSGTTAQRPPNPDYGYVRYNTDLGTIEWWGGGTWVTGSNLINRENIYPDGVNNVFTLGQSTSENAILVNINGTIQQAGVGAYTVTGNQITFAEIPLVTDIIEIRYIAGGVAALSFNFANISSNVSPGANVTYDLGSSSYRWRDLWLSGNSIHIGSESIKVVNGTFQFTSNGGVNSGNVFLGNINSSGKLFVSDVTNVDPYTSGSGALSVLGGISVSKDIWVGGNIYTANLISASTLTVQDPLLYLTANVPTPYNYDIGFFSHFVGGSANVYQHTGIVRDATDNTWNFFSNVKADPGITVDFDDPDIVWDTIKAGRLILANTAIDDALALTGGASINGNLNVTGNINADAGNSIYSYRFLTTGVTPPSQAYTTTASRLHVDTSLNLADNGTISFEDGNSPAILRGNTAYMQAYVNNSTSRQLWYGTADGLIVGNGTTPVAKLDVVGNVRVSANVRINATEASTSTTTGALTVAGGVGIGGNLYIGGSADDAIIATGNVNLAGNILPITSNVLYNIGSVTSWWNVFYGKSTQAQYADLAENYESDNNYVPGTVVIFGGDKEITTTNISHDTRVAGVISENPAYLMNAASAGQPVAFTGRVKCYVKGPVSKGTVLTTSDVSGTAESLDYALHKPGCVLGKSLDTIVDTSIQLIEIVVGRF